MISIINLLSSIVYALAKKEARGICRTSKSIKQSTVGSSTLTEDQLAIKDLTQDYYKKVVEVGDSAPDDLELLIYKKPIQIGLPKISLLDCSIDNFIKEHTLDAILELATKDVLQEQEDTRKIVDKGPWDSFTINVKGTNELQPMIKNLADLLYTPPSAGIPPTPTTTPTVLFSDIVKQQKPNYTVDTASIKPNESVKCKSVEDVLNMLDTITRG